MNAGSRLTKCLAVFILPLALAADDGKGKGEGKGPGGKIEISPDAVNFVKAGSETVLSRSVNVHRTGPPGASIAFTAAASSSGNWLAVSPTAGSIPMNVTVTATPGSMAPGSYSG